MKISYNWLKSIVPFTLSPNEVSEILTDIGLEVEKLLPFSSINGGLENLVIGEVVSIAKHPNADRLKITKVDVGQENPYPIVCGAPNVDAGQKVIVALPGTTIYPLNGEPFKIKKAKIRGEISMGMICAEDEIGLGEGHDGILVLDNDVAVGTLAKDYFNIENDMIFEIGLTPNRADAMGHYGVARDLLVALKFKKIIPENTSLNSLKRINKSSKKHALTIAVQAPIDCPRYSGQIITGVKVSESPKWLKNKLQAIGLNPINNIVDVTNFVLHDLGQPLHAFDLNKISGEKIVIKKAQHNSSFITLDQQERKLDENDLMICNTNEPMCIAGVFGGLASGVTQNTSAVFIESAYFNPHSVRKSAKRHGLNTDASFRFERGVDPEMTLYALQKAVDLILEIAGGEVASQVYDIYPEPIKEHCFEVSFENINKLCGTNLAANEMLKILKLLEIEILEDSKKGAKIKVPAYRVDVQREVDIAEEVLRIYGFNSVVEPRKMNSSINYQTSVSPHFIKNKISDSLVALGLTETLSNSLTSRKYIADKNYNTLLDSDHVELLNPLSSDTDVMRQSLVFNALETVNFNAKNGEQNVRIFEFGKVYKKQENKFVEQEHLLLALSGFQNQEHWYNSKPDVSFFQLHGIVMHLLSSIRLQKSIAYNELKNNLFESGMTISIGENKIADLGLISSQLKKEIGLKDAVYVASLNWDTISSLINFKPIKFQPINKFPKVYRDLSLLIDQEITFDQLKSTAFKTNSAILKNIFLFDIYKGKGTAENKKSYALRFELVHENHTLTEKEIDRSMSSIQAAFSKQYNATLR